jgi:uncharacterized membrane protein
MSFRSSWTIIFLGVFIAYQLDRVSLQPSVGLAALMVFDPGSPG